MPYREAWMKVTVWVPPDRPDFPERPPGWGQPLPPWPEGPTDPDRPPGRPDRPEWPEGPWEPGLPDTGGPRPPQWPGFPERPGQPLPPVRPPTGPWPIVPDDEDGDREGHPPLPDLNMPGRWTTVTMARTGHGASWPAWVIDPDREPPMVEEDYEPKHPENGLPGSWVTILYRGALAWAWVPDVGGEDGEDGGEEGEGRRRR